MKDIHLILFTNSINQNLTKFYLAIKGCPHCSKINVSDIYTTLMKVMLCSFLVNEQNINKAFSLLIAKIILNLFIKPILLISNFSNSI